VDPATDEALLSRAHAERCAVSEIARLALEQYLRDDAHCDTPVHVRAVRGAE